MLPLQGGYCLACTRRRDGRTEADSRNVSAGSRRRVRSDVGSGEGPAQHEGDVRDRVPVDLRRDDDTLTCRYCGQPLPVASLESLDPAAAAEITGVTLRQVYRWKSGEARPAPKRLELLKNAGLL